MAVPIGQLTPPPPLRRPRRLRPVGVGQLTGTPGYGGGYYRGTHRVIKTYPQGYSIRPAGAGVNPTRAHPTLTLWQQALKLSNNALNPLLAETNASFDRERAAQMAAIAAATDRYVKASQQYGPAVAGAYRTAEGAQSAGDSALAGLLQGKGAQGAADLTAQLQAAPGSENAAALDAVGRGAASAGYGMGSADLDKLLASGTAAAGYGARLPGIAALTGLEDTRTALGKLAQERADALGKLRSGGGSQALSIYQNMLSSRSSAANAQANRDLQKWIAQNSGLVSMSNAQTHADTSAAALNERILHDRALEKNATASVEQRRQAAADRLEAQQILHQQQAGAKKVRHGKQRQSAFYSTRAKAFSMAHSLAHPAGSGGGGGGPLSGGGTGAAPLDRHKAYDQVWAKWAPVLIHEWGFKPAAVRLMVQRAINTAYGKPPRKARGGPVYNPLTPPVLPGTPGP